MKFRLFIAAFIIALTACTDQAPTQTPETDALRRPNFIVIYTDDHGYADLGVMDYAKDIRTPHMDALARSGAMMTHGYVTAPICAPSRAGLLTGRYQNTFGIETNLDFLQPKGRAGFALEETIAERLLAKGYRTGMAGKWHLGPPKAISQHGFENFFQSKGTHPAVMNFKPEDYGLSGPELRGGYHIDAGASFAAAFIDKHAEDPFFFYWAPRAPHVPLDADPKYLERFPEDISERRRQALAMMSAVDDGVGDIMAALARHDLTRDTVVFIISDNGAPLRISKREDGPVTSGWNGSLNAPLTGEKALLLEGGIRVPFLVSWPGKIAAATVYDQPVITLDVAATMAKLAGSPPLDNQTGQNLLPFLSGENIQNPHENLYWKFQSQSAIRQGDWKLIKFDGRTYLYDVAQDFAERHNLAADMPDKVAHLDERLSEWMAGLPAPAADGGQKAKVEFSAKRTAIFYDHYLDGQTNVDIDQLYRDWEWGLTRSDLLESAKEKVREDED